jgi:ABC-type glycerol-3-phosphate transport system substrate-binding protein
MDLPTPQMSQNDFVTYLASLRTKINQTAATNEYGVKYSEAVKFLVDVNAGWDSWVWPLFKGFGAEVVDETGAAAFDSKESLDALKFWQGMVAEDYVDAVKNGGSVGVQFRMQQAPFLCHSRAWTTALVKKTDQIKGVSKLGVTALPQLGKNYAVGGGSSGYAMYKHTANKTEAWLFLKFVASEAGQNAFSMTGNCVPSRKSLLESDTAAWRTWTHERLGGGFDNDAFIYKLSDENPPFTSTREFFQYVPLEAQSSVLSCLQTTLAAIDTAKSDTELKEKITAQAQMIDYYVGKYQKK